MALSYHHDSAHYRQLALEVQHFTKPVIATLLVGPLAWFLVFGILYSTSIGNITSPQYLGAFVEMFGSAFFWFVSIFSIGFAMLPIFVMEYLSATLWPIPNQIAAEIQKYNCAMPAEPAVRKFEEPAGYSRYV